MARARNIKPSFFDNDELAENDPLGRLLFIGLWTLADYRGNVEWRSKRIKKQLLAYDNCDVEQLAINLDKTGFIQFYSDGEEIYLKIINFEKHQNPHKNEKAKGSEIPEYSESMRQVVDLSTLTINHDKSRLERNCYDSNPADSLFLIPDSPILIPDTCNKDLSANADNDQVISEINQTDHDKEERPLTTDKRVIEIFHYWCDSMRKNRLTAKMTPKRTKAIRDRLRQGYTMDDIKLAIYNCSQDPWSMGNNDRQKPFNDIELICRSGEKLESYLDAVQQKAAARNVNSIGTDFSPPKGWNT